MSNTSQSARSPANERLIDALRTELDRARKNLDRLAAEYNSLLADQDTIQEDRDSAGQLVADARAAATRAETALASAEAGSYGRCVRMRRGDPRRAVRSAAGHGPLPRV